MTSNASYRHIRRLVLWGLAAALVFAGTAAETLAQDQTVVVGGAGGSQVQVDLSVLDGYGGWAGPARRDLLFPGSEFKPGQRIILKRPGSQPKRVRLRKPRGQPALRTVRKRRAAPAKTTDTAVRQSRRARAAAERTDPIERRGKTRTKPEKTPPPPAPQARATPKSRATANLEAPPMAPPPPMIKSKPKGESPRGAVPPAPAPTRATRPESMASSLPPPPPPPPPVTAAPRQPVAKEPLVQVPRVPPKATKRSQQVAAIPRIGPIASGSRLRILFAPGSARLDSDSQALLGRLSAALGKDSKLRVELKAYARGSSGTESQARRLSLSRALVIRSQLIRRGVRATRIDVRALGNKVPEGIPNRVDLLVFTR